MTTALVVEANHGWPVRVTHIARALVGGAESQVESIVKPGETRRFHVYDGCDILVHEIQPDELPADLRPPPDP